jgi:hypothetical protein
MKKLHGRLVLLAILGLLTPALSASELEKKTVVTFSQPVEIPGTVLPAGEYVIKRADPSMPNVIRFMNPDETHVYATVRGLPTQRNEAADQVQIAFEERASHAPQAMKKWFYPGELTGMELVYPEPGETLLASNTLKPAESQQHQSGSDSAAVSSRTPDAQPVMATKEATNESNEPMEIAQATTPANPAETPAAAQSAEPQNPAQQSAELPSTASRLPLAASLGGLFILAGAFLRRFTRRMTC